MQITVNKIEKLPNIILFSEKLKFRFLIVKSELGKTKQRLNRIMRYNFVLELKVNLSSIIPIIRNIDDIIIKEIFSLNVNMLSFMPKNSKL